MYSLSAQIRNQTETQNHQNPYIMKFDPTKVLPHSTGNLHSISWGKPQQKIMFKKKNTYV